jgi:hypothetical protein
MILISWRACDEPLHAPNKLVFLFCKREGVEQFEYLAVKR